MKQDDLMFMVQIQHPKPLGTIKTHDILQVAKRIFRQKGIVCVGEVYQKCRTRIPGNIARYAASLRKFNRHNASR